MAAELEKDHADKADKYETEEHNHTFEEGEEAVPKGVHAMAITRWVLLGAMVLAAFGSVYSYAAPLLGKSASSTQKGAVYRCPMHPQIVSDRPGECPICHMTLELVPEDQMKQSGAHEHEKADEAKGYWCPMHHQVKSDKPGQCPICHMDLVPIPKAKSKPAPTAPSAAATASASAAPSASAAASAEHTHSATVSAIKKVKNDEEKPADTKGYWCPMHHQVRSDKPGQCPICHMDLVPIPANENANQSAETSAASPDKGESPKGTTEISLSLDRTQAIGVRTAKVERLGNSDELMRVTAAVEVPEQGVAEVHVRSPGFVEAIQVKQTGVKVKAGQALVSIYSPEIFRAQQELLAMKAWPTEGPGAAPNKPLDVAYKRLELLGLGKRAIDHIVQTGKPIRAVTISSPISGYVVKKSVVLGSYVMPESTLFEIADLSRVYIVASVYPHQLAGLRVGDEATFSASALGGREFKTKVDLIYPDVDLATRTARVRFQVKNDDLVLRPGQFGTIELSGSGSDALTVPLDAIIDTGRSVYVFVVEEKTRFIPRKVELGEQIEDRVVVRGGLHEGERVVSGATFLIDAESRLQASLSESQP